MSLAELVRLFGSDVAGLVAEVSDDKNLTREERKRLQVESAAAKPDRVKLLRLADKTSNLRSTTLSPPADWSLARRRGYLDWARAVAAGLRGVNPWLEQQFDGAAAELEERLQQEEAKI